MDVTELKKYPRTPHLPTSPGATADDVYSNWDAFTADEIVVTLKMDGENTTLHSSGMYARSATGRSRPWQSRMRALAATICPSIPPGWLVCGENLTVTHSIEYAREVPPFAIFSVWDGDQCLSWDDTKTVAEMLGCPVVPVIYTGPRIPLGEIHSRFTAVTDTENDEGYVVRNAGSFNRSEFATNVAKWVRPGHIRTGKGWPARAA